MFVRAYLRTSTLEQDASRARAQLDAFAAERGLSIAACYVENESGAKLVRPELFRLLADCRPGDVLLVEQVDRLSRLTEADWRQLRAEIDAKRIRIVALDLPTSWSLAAPPDEFTGRMFTAVNAMMLDVLAAVARKDYDDRRRRQAEGTAKRGRPASIRAGGRTRPAMTESPPCCAPDRPGSRYGMPRGAVGAPLRRSGSASMPERTRGAPAYPPRGPYISTASSLNALNRKLR